VGTTHASNTHTPSAHTHTRIRLACSLIGHNPPEELKAVASVFNSSGQLSHSPSASIEQNDEAEAGMSKTDRINFTISLDPNTHHSQQPPAASNQYPQLNRYP
jgi:hypothetical protein